MNEPGFDQEAVNAAYGMFSGAIKEARKDMEDGSFLTLQSSLRKIEKRAKGLHYAEQFSDLSRRIEELENKIASTRNHPE